MVSSDDPTSLPVAAAAGALLAVAATAACRALWLRGSAIISAGRQARNLPGRSKIVYTENEAADAYTLPGWPCRIVVTTGMLDALSQPERRVLLAHERAHAAWLHYLFTSATRLAAAANPLLIPVLRAVDYTLERWADEHAAAVTSDRKLVARTIGQVALLAGTARQRPAGLALGIVRPGTSRVSLAWAGPVPRRVAALLTAPPRRQMLLLTVCALIVLSAVVAALLAAGDLHALIELAQGAH